MPPRHTSDRTTALSLFKEETSLSLRVVVFCVLAICLMVGDAKLQLSPVVRQSVAVVTSPLSWAAAQPLRWWHGISGYFSDLDKARMEEDAVRVRLAQQSLRAALVENLMLENERLRSMLYLSERTDLDGRAAEVLFETPDLYSQRLVVDRGLVHGVKEGSPVLDDLGVIGQVSRALPLTSEITLLTSEGFTVSIINARTGVFGVVYGNPSAGALGGGDALELRFMSHNADIEQGDLLISSGMDGIYPTGLPVARVVAIEKNPTDQFMKIWCLPVARVHNTRYVMLVKPSSQMNEESRKLETGSRVQQQEEVPTPVQEGEAQ